jgi:hypothetical protein
MLQSGDEPPYPLEAPERLYRAVVAAEGAWDHIGYLMLNVSVTKEGRAESVTVIESANPRMIDIAKKMALEALYKPAQCSGKPCPMVFPYAIWSNR